jgi:hypothetical protein
MEIWKSINLSAKYQYDVSSYGRIRRHNKCPERFGQYSYLNGCKSKYICVNIDGKIYNLHKIIANAFIPNPNLYKCVMHLDNNPHNNNIDNLQWGTHSMNIKQCVSDGRHKGFENGIGISYNELR